MPLTKTRVAPMAARRPCLRAGSGFAALMAHAGQKRAKCTESNHAMQTAAHLVQPFDVIAIMHLQNAS
jgi:hypothetical protein